MHPLRHLLAGADEMDGVVGGVGAVWHTLGLHLAVGKGDAGDDQAGAALGAFRVIVDSPLIKAALGVSQSQRTHGGQGKTVFQCDRSYFHRCEQIFVLHSISPLCYFINNIVP